jgi:hypothetical protein
MKQLLSLAVISTAAYAQSDTASLSGVVTDSASAAMPGAKIVLRNVATRSQRNAISDILGLYHFSLLIPGVYERIHGGTSSPYKKPRSDSVARRRV